jgi:hypothetical protein
VASSVIDSLVVTLGLDSKAFASGVRGSASELANFTRRLAGMFIAIRGLEDAVDYFKDLHHQLAEIGFTSKNLGVMGTELKRLGEVSELFGGQMDDAMQSVEGLQSAIFGLKYRGEMSESLMMLQRFGVAYLTATGHMRNFRDIAMDAAHAIERQAKTAGLDKGERYQMALSFGFTGGIASAVAQGGKGLEDALSKAQVDQRALTEKTITGQVKLDQDITRLHEATAAQSSALLNSMRPAIEDAVKELRKLADQVLPWLNTKLEELINFLKNPPAWLKSIEDDLKGLTSLLGPTGSLIAGLAALTAAIGTGGALLGGITTLASTLLRFGGALGLAGFGGYEVGKFVNEKLGHAVGEESLGDWLGSEDWDSFANLGKSLKKKLFPETPSGSSFLSNFGLPMLGGPGAGFITPPSITTPTATRPPASESSSSTPPTAMTGGPGTNVQIDSITVNTRATDANGIAGDINGALRRKLLVSSADVGLA